jgi:hypothetical protein
VNRKLKQRVLEFEKYEGYPKSKFQWAVEKTIIYFQTFYIAI